MGHIIERALIHFFVSGLLVLGAFFAYRYWAHQNRKVATWIPDGRPMLAIAALSVFALSTLREPFDVAAGQTTLKACTDFMSWFAGCGVSSWGLYRFKKL